MKNVVVLITINQILAYSDNKHNAVGHNCNKKAWMREAGGGWDREWNGLKLAAICFEQAFATL